MPKQHMHVSACTGVSAPAAAAASAMPSAAAHANAQALLEVGGSLSFFSSSLPPCVCMSVRQTLMEVELASL